MLSVLPRQAVNEPALYTTQLQAGLGLVHETTTLLGYWRPGMEATELHRVALEAGAFPNVSARRLRNIVAECFAPRYLRGEGPPARYLQQLILALPSTELVQLYFLYTCRANRILGDFVRTVYWDRYASGAHFVGKDDAFAFIERAIDDGKTTKRWSEGTVIRVGTYLIGTCADYPSIRARHQVANFVRFCETVLKAPTVRNIRLLVGYDDQTDLAELQESLGELQQSLLELDVVLEIELTKLLHDREIRIDNGWIIKIGRGLDFYQKPDSWFAVGTSDFSLRKCLETKVDIFKLA